MTPLPIPEGVAASAELSMCGTYRYTLTRTWAPERGLVLWVMLNPSTADALTDDPTLRRIQQYARDRDWGYGGVKVANLYALRSRDPDQLLLHPDPVGPTNDLHLEWLFHHDDIKLIVAGWGTKAGPQRAATFLGHAWKAGRTVYCLESLTKDGHPRHPLYGKAEWKPVVYREGSNASQVNGGTVEA